MGNLVKSLYAFGADVKHNVGAASKQGDRRQCSNETRRVLTRLQGIGQSKSNADLFILGSAPSVLDLREFEFTVISRSLSIGLGYWAFHPFRPDAYYTEGSVDRRGWELWQQYITPRARENPRPLMIIDSANFRRSQPDSDLAWVKERFAEDFFNIQTLAANAASHVMLNLLLRGHRAGLTGSRLMHFRSSLSAVLDIAARLPSVERVILVGVDLRDRRYFWNSLGIQYVYPGYEGKSDMSHSTMYKTNEYDNLPVIDFIRIFNETVLRPKGKELLVGSMKSRLAEFLPLWDGA